MRLQLIIILFFIFAACYAQSKKDTAKLSGKNSLAAVKEYREKQDTSLLRIQQFFLNHHILFSISDLPYYDVLHRPSLIKEFEKIVKTPTQQAEDNLKNVIVEIRAETEDKRGWFLKFLQGFLGVAKVAAAAVLAAIVLLK